jgi:nitroimidazol reductase NimA-like FMN-containing flavoprotein (pyridoxamine 5'-phosphate oxidase superfamily)
VVTTRSRDRCRRAAGLTRLPQVTEADIARAVLGGNSFMTLATADADGLPWATPVWFATEDYRSLYWVSAPNTQHSRNVAARQEITVVVFDSRQRPGAVQAVYMTATAAQVTDAADIEQGMAVYSRIAERDGLDGWHVDRVTGSARLRLYRASVIGHYILDPRAATDTRLRVTL